MKYSNFIGSPIYLNEEQINQIKVIVLSFILLSYNSVSLLGKGITPALACLYSQQYLVIH